MEGGKSMQDMISEMEARIVSAISNKLDKKFDETLDKMSSRITQNEQSITAMQEGQKDLTEKVDNLTARYDVDSETLVDNTERLDNIDRTNKCFELRLKETEKSIDEINSKGGNNPKLDKLGRELSELKNSLSKKSYADIVQENSNNKEDQKSPQTPKLNSQKLAERKSPQSTTGDDIFKEARGKIGLYPIGIEDIKKYGDQDVDDIEIMTKYSQIESRHKAAQEFLMKQMHFQIGEITIHTIKMASNWNSKIMWIEVGEQTVQRLLNRSITLKNPNIQLVTYYPARLWNKRKEMNEIMKEVRKSNPELRYQIKVGKSDLILKTKMSSEFVWQITPIEEYVKYRKKPILTESAISSPVYKRSTKRTITPEKINGDTKKQRNQDSGDKL